MITPGSLGVSGSKIIVMMMIVVMVDVAPRKASALERPRMCVCLFSLLLLAPLPASLSSGHQSGLQGPKPQCQGLLNG